MSENPFAEATDTETRLDATLVNIMTQMGTSGDRSEYTGIGKGKRIPKQHLEELYRVPICRRVVNARADSAILKGWSLTLGNDSDQKIIGKFTKYHDRLQVKKKFRDAQVQANIYGGAAIVLVADDGKTAKEPLDEKKIKTITSLEVLDRYKIQPILNLGIDPSEPEFYRLLLPQFLENKFNQLFPDEAGRDFLIHSSRVIRFDGVSYTPDMLWENEGWGGSVLESLWEDYRDWKTAVKALGAMIQDCSVFVYKLKGLAAMVKTQDEQLLKSRLHVMRMMISVFGGFAADADGESIDFPSRNFGGVDQVANQLRDAFIGATGIPHDRLFGESPSGLGATGESEEKNWSHDVASFQQTEWLPKLLVIGKQIFLAKDGPSSGKEPEDWGFDFPSLLQQSETDVVGNRSTQASTDNTYLSAGVLLPEEVRASRFGGSKYSIETVLDEKLYAKKQKEAEDQQQQQFGGYDDGSATPEDEPPQEEQTTNQDSIERLALSEAERYDALYSELPKDDEGRVKYLGKWWHPNKPVKSDRTGKKRMVLAKKGDRVKLVHYGAEGYQHNYSESAKKNYLTRSAGIKDKDGNATKDDPFSPNHWARKDLWNEKLPADGSTLYQGNGKGKKCGDGYTSAKNECRTDAADPPKRIISWNGISIGVTHEPGDTRFLLSRPMASSYGHIRRSYGDAPDGKALDVYLGDRLESPQAYKVRQLDPQTGMPDEDKYFIGFEDPGSARDCFTYHAGRDRFGGIEKVDPSELQVYRQDGCGDATPTLSSGVQTFGTKLFANGAPTSDEVLNIVQSTFPEQILKLGDWKYKADGTVDGEFYAPVGVYGFGIKNNYCGYAWKRELRTDSATRKRKDSDPVRSGYTWVKDPSVKGGGYWRKGEAKKKELAQGKGNSSINNLRQELKKISEIDELPENENELRPIREILNGSIIKTVDSLKASDTDEILELKKIVDDYHEFKDGSAITSSKKTKEYFNDKLFSKAFPADNMPYSKTPSGNHEIESDRDLLAHKLQQWGEKAAELKEQQSNPKIKNRLEGSRKVAFWANLTPSSPLNAVGIKGSDGEIALIGTYARDFQNKALSLQGINVNPEYIANPSSSPNKNLGKEYLQLLHQESKRVGFSGRLVGQPTKDSLPLYLRMGAKPLNNEKKEYYFEPESNRNDSFLGTIHLFKFAQLSSLSESRIDSDVDEDIVDLIVKKYTKKLPINYWVRTVNKNIQQFTSLQELRDRIPEIYPKLSPKIFTEVIEQCRMLSQLAGMVDVEDEGRSSEEEGRSEENTQDSLPSSFFKSDAKAPNWLSQPFSEAIAYFRRKVIIPTQRWDEFTAQNHDFAFTVSGLQRADLLEDVRWLVDQAITQGNDIETFKDQFQRLIGRKGWRPNDKRIYTILDTNSRRAYAAGRYEQINKPEVLERRPFLIWKHRDSVVPRPHHLALDNKAIAASDPFWKVAFPMCAWGCRCSAFSANERMLQRIGAQILTNPPDPKTIADPGFQRAPGLSPEEDRQDVLSQGIMGLSPDIAALVKPTQE